VTVSEIETQANQNNELPPDLTQPEELLFLSLRVLYRDYKSGTILKDQAHREKLNILKAYESNKIWCEIYQNTAEMRNRLSRYFSEIEKGGCDKCRLAIKIFDGRMK